MSHPSTIDSVRAAPEATLTPRSIYELRRWRDANATGDHFGEPAWDMLLQLAIARDEDRTIAPSELGAASAATEAARATVIARLVADGLIAGPDNADGYRLSDTGTAFIDTVFDPIRG